MRIQYAVIAHHGINDHGTVGVEKLVFDLFDHIDLFYASEVSADDIIVF